MVNLFSIYLYDAKNLYIFSYYQDGDQDHYSRVKFIVLDSNAILYGKSTTSAVAIMFFIIFNFK